MVDRPVSFDAAQELNGGQDEEAPATPQELARAAQATQASPFVQQCLRLREWLGDSKPVTQAGYLRPSVAREAYLYLDLWPWDRALRRAQFPGQALDDLGPEADAAMAEATLHSWRSAVDCLALDRLW